MERTRKIQEKTYSRQMFIDRNSVNEEERTAIIAFSSEEPVEQWYGFEILDHKSDSVMLERLNTKAQFLFNHDRDKIVGVIESAWIDADKKGRAKVRYAKSVLAEEVFRNVIDGIINHVSVAYEIKDIVLEKKENEIETFRVMKWKPYEISQVTIPADITVGIGRQLDNNTTELIENGSIKILANERGKGMNEEEKNALINEGVSQESKRVAELTKVAKDNNCENLLGEAISSKRSVPEFMYTVLELARKRTEESSAGSLFGVPKKDLKRFSVLKAIKYIESGNTLPGGFEKEMSDEMCRSLKRETTGMLIPTQLIRAFSTSEGSGKGIIQDTLSFSDFIPLLRSSTVLSKLGARWLTGLQGTFSLPKQTAGSNAFWIAEGDTRRQELLSSYGTGQTKLSPKTVIAAVDVTHKLLKQTSYDVENFVLNEMIAGLALEIDRCALLGFDGDDAINAPIGLLKMAKVQKIGKPDGSMTYKDCVDLYTKVANQKVIGGTKSYLTNPVVSGLLKTSPMFTNGSVPIWREGGAEDEGFIGGSKAYESAIVPSNLGAAKNENLMFLGRFSDMLVGEWGVAEIMRDPYTLGLTGDVRIRISLDVDVAVRYEEAFVIREGIKV